MNRTIISDVCLPNHCDLILDVAGKDSYAAIIKFLDEIWPYSVTISPILVKAPTEYGDLDASITSFNNFRSYIIEIYNVEMLPIIVIEEPEYWHIMCGRFASTIQEKLHFYTPCIGCHVYFHSIRAFIAEKNNVRFIVSGERYLHDSRKKINQTLSAVKYHSVLLSRFGCYHIQPLLNISSDDVIRKILEPYEKDRILHLNCVFDSNYISFSEESLKQERVDSYYDLCLNLAQSYFGLYKNGLGYKQIEIEMCKIVESWKSL